MKKQLTILLSVLSLTLMAQVPQGVGYQGVATDANGIELVNQSISIRASVLSGSATGTIEWEETHATTTDTFGLFTLTIGQGTNTTNGLQTSFADISWGTNTHFLKIEMDVTGGSTYSNMGTNQMMSVPYALFAESANINYDSISNFLSGDSTFITNVGGGMGGGGCDFNYPDGLDGDPITFNGYYNDYTVPAGKKLYITTPFVTSNQSISIDGIDLGVALNNNGGSAVHNAIVANEGQIVGGTGNFHGLLFDNSLIEAVTFLTAGSTDYTVPLGKELYILHQYGPGGSGIKIDGILITEGANRSMSNGEWSVGTPIKLIAGQVVSSLYSSSFNGYLVDENYFANCGGGGSSSTSSSTGGGSGCDIQYPEGLDGEPITYDLSSSYTVPAGKNLYITNLYSQSGFFSIDGVNVHHSYSNYNQSSKTAMPFIAKQGQVLLHSSSAGSFNGFLVDALVEPITYNLSSSYTVPVGKNLYITNLYSQSGFFSIDGVNVHMGYSNYNEGPKTAMPFIAKQGQVLLHSSSAGSFNGYLVDENYFADCGGAAVPGPQGPQGPPGPAGPSFFSNMQGGKVDVGNVTSADVLKVVAVVFPTAFTNPPNVICTAAEQPGTIYDDSFNITVRLITTTGFEMVVNRVDGTWWGQDLDAFWLAFE
jgi:hypothetical protein